MIKAVAKVIGAFMQENMSRGYKTLFMLNLAEHEILIRVRNENYFLISQPKHMLWVLKRTVSMRGFF